MFSWRTTWIVDGSPEHGFVEKPRIPTFRAGAYTNCLNLPLKIVWWFTYHCYLCSGRISNQCLCLLLGFLLCLRKYPEIGMFHPEQWGPFIRLFSSCSSLQNIGLTHPTKVALLNQPVPGQRFGAPSHCFGRALGQNAGGGSRKTQQSTWLYKVIYKVISIIIDLFAKIWRRWDW